MEGNLLATRPIAAARLAWVGPCARMALPLARRCSAWSQLDARKCSTGRCGGWESGLPACHAMRQYESSSGGGHGLRALTSGS